MKTEPSESTKRLPQNQLGNNRYLDLLELAIGDGLHGRACRPLRKHGRRHTFWGTLLKAICWSIERTGIVPCLPPDSGWPEIGDTMLSVEALHNIREVLEICHAEGIAGDFVECGVWRGGGCVFAKAVVNELGDDRRVFGCDSFDGLPRPTVGDSKNDSHHTFSPLAVSLNEVKLRAAKYNVGQIEWREGFFNKSLPLVRMEIERIAVLRCDGDMYSSTRDILDNLYSKVEKGGFVIIDDWLLPDCKRAVIDFLGFSPKIERITDYGSVMFRKREASAIVHE